MVLPQIQAKKPITIPAQTEKVYPDWHNVLLLVRAADNVAVVNFRPYDYNTKELYPESDKDISKTFNDFWGMMGKRPTLANAMGILALELEKLAKEIELGILIEEKQNEITDDPDNATLQTELSDLQTELNTVLASYNV